MFREPFTICADCRSMFVKPYGRVPECPRCGADADLPGAVAETGEYMFDCAQKPYTPEVQ